VSTQLPEDLKALLPPRPKEPRRAPWRALLSFLLPAAALAAGVGLQRFFEGPNPPGDALLRWLLWSSGVGVILGAVAELFRRARGAWVAYGAVSPWLVALCVVGTVQAVKPVRELVADRREAACRESGRQICTVHEFRQRCAAGDAAALGQPESRLCSGGSCTSRWLYTGPFRPDNYVAPGSLLCSVVVDTDGKLARTSVIPGYKRE
jgi:hypothetical protein